MSTARFIPPCSHGAWRDRVLEEQRAARAARQNQASPSPSPSLATSWDLGQSGATMGRFSAKMNHEVQLARAGGQILPHLVSASDREQVVREVMLNVMHRRPLSRSSLGSMKSLLRPPPPARLPSPVPSIQVKNFSDTSSLSSLSGLRCPSEVSGMTSDSRLQRLEQRLEVEKGNREEVQQQLSMLKHLIQETLLVNPKGAVL
uniref:Uncharacterized protein n=1 Tax=Eutreptiella gymnastica TaxID=73025 RepID=A0A7S1NKP7_9EUGL|mmetsp:Transcript_50649/g.90503  ORF Transcript_50649/g.90503 Transcript_50649/m.90503 type:complete len:203 (+) Transcript_50649:75-683(+)